MKLNLLAALLLSAAFAPAADTAPFTGKWEVYINVADREVYQTCTFTQKDNDLTGSCSSDVAGSANITGKIDDNKVSWTFAGGTVTLTFKGTLSKTPEGIPTIAGSLNVEEYGVQGQFSATPSK